MQAFSAAFECLLLEKWACIRALLSSVFCSWLCSLFYRLLAPLPRPALEITWHRGNYTALKTNPMDLPVRENSLAIHERWCILRGRQ